MILLTGILLWMLIALSFVGCLRAAGRPGCVLKRSLQVAVVLVTAFVVLLFFRPDEEVTAGEDPGAYFNAALSFADRQRLVFSDPAFRELDPAERLLFRYGHRGFRLTKDAVLWARDPEFARIGPHFFPAYSILLAVPATLGFPYAAFWLSPLLALMTAWLLSLFARSLTGSRTAGGIAFGLYVLHPAVIWNARCLRAEWPAAFLALAGLALWLAHVAQDKPVRPRTAFLAGLASVSAALFHATAFYVLIPLTAASLGLTRRNAFWRAWWCGLLSGGALFIAQMVWITDPYGISNSLAQPGRRMTVAAALLGLGVWGIAWQGWRRRSRFRHPGAARIAGGIAAAGYVAAALLLMRLRTEQGRLPGLPAWSVAFINLTDFSGVRLIFSRLGLAVALAGVVVLCIRPGRPGSLGRWLFFLLAPAGLTIGWMHNFMFETRRLVAFLVPLLVLGTTTLLVTAGRMLAAWYVRWFPHYAGGMETGAVAGAAGRRSVSGGDATKSPFPVAVLSSGLACCMAGILLLAGARGRLPLYTTWNNRGTYGYYRELADDIRKEADFLWAEYTQTAAPLERLAGRPLLPVAWEYRSEDEYRGAEKVFERLLRQRPGRRYVLITPFSGTALPGAWIEPLFSRTLDTVRLGRARRSIPGDAARRRRTLHVYRVLPDRPESPDRPYLRSMDGGKLGLAGSANFMRGRPITMEGMRIDAGRTVELDLPFPAAPAGPGRLHVMLAVTGEPPSVQVIGEGMALPAVPSRQFSAGSGWQGMEIPVIAEGETPSRLRIHAPENTFLAALFWWPEQAALPQRLPFREPTEYWTIPDADSQWLRAEAAVALPGSAATRLLWMLATRGSRDAPDVMLTIRDPDHAAPVSLPVPEGWHWQLVPLPAAGPGPFRWHQLTVDPPWDPGLPGFPGDLGLRVHRLAVLDHDPVSRMDVLQKSP